MFTATKTFRPQTPNLFIYLFKAGAAAAALARSPEGCPALHVPPPPPDRWSWLGSVRRGQRRLAEQTEQTPSDGPDWTNGASEGRLSDARARHVFPPPTPPSVIPPAERKGNKRGNEGEK